MWPIFFDMHCNEIDLLFSEKPTAPRNLHVISTSNGRIKVAWDIPDTDGGSPITGYIIEICSTADTKYRKVMLIRNVAIYGKVQCTEQIKLKSDDADIRTKVTSK